MGTDEESETDAGGERSVVVVRLRSAIRWLRDLHRGYAYTGHLPRRRN